MNKKKCILILPILSFPISYLIKVILFLIFKFDILTDILFFSLLISINSYSFINVISDKK